MLKLEAGPLDALLKRDGLVGNEVLVDVVELLVGLARVLERRLDKVGLRQVEVDVGRRVDEEGVESLSSPLQSGDTIQMSVNCWSSSASRARTDLNGVLDGVGEALEGAHGDALLRRVLAGRVRLGDVGDDDLSVTLGAERSRLEQRLLVEDASSVHVLS